MLRRPWAERPFVPVAVALYGAFCLRAAFTLDGVTHFCLFDDAMISMRYARHLAGGHGLVWNPGEAPVEGYSNLALALWLTLFRIRLFGMGGGDAGESPDMADRFLAVATTLAALGATGGVSLGPAARRRLCFAPAAPCAGRHGPPSPGPRRGALGPPSAFRGRPGKGRLGRRERRCGTPEASLPAEHHEISSSTVDTLSLDDARRVRRRQRRHRRGGQRRRRRLGRGRRRGQLRGRR